MGKPGDSEVLIAIRDKKLLPILKLDRGFVYPEYPSQVVVSYFQAGSICDFIKSRWGEGKTARDDPFLCKSTDNAADRRA